MVRHATYRELSFGGSLICMRVAGRFLLVFVCGTFLGGTLVAQDRSALPQCVEASVSFALKAGTSFEQPIGDLVFKLQPLDSPGWTVSLEDTGGRDFIYPVNPPLRLNPSQTLGAGYGNSARESLSSGRELRFLLNKGDYDGFWPHVEHALWPYNAPNPTDTTDEYFSELEKLRTGLLRLTIVRSDISDADEIRSAELHVEFIAPSSFTFDPSLAPHAVSCPAPTLPLQEQLRARIPEREPAKYRKVQDAESWKNPFLTITREGVDLHFQGERIAGPLSVLARTVAGLPDSAWPYGRVIAGAENGLRAADHVDDAVIKSNREEADQILRGL